MSDVLTKEEALYIEVNHRSGGSLAPGLLAIVDRLVSEVAILRARNEKLEAVAKAATEFREAYQLYIDDEDGELPDTGPGLDAALAALNQP